MREMNSSSKRKTLLPILIIAGTIVLCCGFCAVVSALAYFLPSEIKLVNPSGTESTSNTPTQSIRLECVQVDKVRINEKDLSYEEISDLCGKKGYTVNLNDGENLFAIIAENAGESNTDSLEIKISFDKKTYEVEKAKQDEEARKQAEADAKTKAEAEAKAQAEEEAELNGYAASYCSNRKSLTRKFSPITVSDNIVTHEFTKGKAGKYLAKADCRNIINGLVKYMEMKEGEIDSENMETIIAGKYYMEIDEHYFYVSIGDPNDINTSEYGSYTQNQAVYYKDAYGISAEYFYFDDGVLTSHQDF